MIPGDANQEITALGHDVSQTWSASVGSVADQQFTWLDVETVQPLATRIVGNLDLDELTQPGVVGRMNPPAFALAARRAYARRVDQSHV
ncbi:hypothetical protein D3C87_1522890 [compost metagenome]